MMTSKESKTNPPPLGSMARPVVCRGDRLAACPWSGCGGEVISATFGLYRCKICKTWFQLLPT